MDTYKLVLPVESGPTDSTETHIRVDQLQSKGRMVIRNTHLNHAAGGRDIDNEHVAGGLEYERPHNALYFNPLTIVGAGRELREDDCARSGHGPGPKHSPVCLCHDGSKARSYNTLEIDSLPWPWRIRGPRYIHPDTGCG